MRFDGLEVPGVTPEVYAYLEKFAANAEEGALLEANLDALAWIAKISERLERGYLLAIDYGYTALKLFASPRAR